MIVQDFPAIRTPLHDQGEWATLRHLGVARPNGFGTGCGAGGLEQAVPTRDNTNGQRDMWARSEVDETWPRLPGGAR